MAEHLDAAVSQVGAFGATTERTLRITSAQGTVFSATVYSCVNALDHPEVVEELWAGTLHHVPCPFEEGRVYELAVPVMYHDQGREVFALVVPEALRHEELSLRQEVLRKLEEADGVVPDYIREFATVVGLDGLRRWLKNGVERREVAPDTTVITERPAMESGREASEVSKVDEELKEREAELDAREEELRVQREQFEEVASRVERDSARVDEAMGQIAHEREELQQLREELEEQRRQLQVQELNLEQERLRLEQGAADSEVVETTQVVTDDQFIEVISEEEAGSTVVPASADAAPTSFPETGRPFFVEIGDSGMVLGFSVADARVEAFGEGDVRFFFQLHRVEGVPAIALTLVCFDEAGDAIDAVAAGIVDQGEESRWLDQIIEFPTVRIGVYDESGAKVAAWETAQPEPRNVEWARELVRQWSQEAGSGGAKKLAEAAEKVMDGAVELWGSMRHPFHQNSFEELDGAAEVQLAAGILGYWSRPEQVEYLVGSRSFPLASFRDIQKRVIRAALHWGIALSEDLRQVAIDHAIIPDPLSLTQRLVANFAEVCIGLRPNDLDPLEQWENWDALIKLADKYGVVIDPDVAELAEVSLKRAEEFEELDEAAPQPPMPDVEVEGLVVARRSEHTGITYFLPDEALMDTFDDLSSMDREDLVLLLKDENGRLEAAQILIERHGEEHLWEVLEAAEEMNAAQVTALAKFVEVRVDGLEPALIQSLDDLGAAGTFIAARALAAVGSSASLPKLLEALQDPNRRGHGRRLAKTLAKFGDRLLPPLTRALKTAPEDEALLRGLEALDEARPGTLEELASDRSQVLRKVAKVVRERVG